METINLSLGALGYVEDENTLISVKHLMLSK